MAPPFTLRLCTPADGHALAELASRLFALTYSATHPEPHLRRYMAQELSVERVTAELGDPGTRVWWALDSSGHAIAYLWLRDAPPPSSVTVTHRRPLHMRRIFVEPSWHGRRVADALMDACAAEAEHRGADLLWLAVWQRASRPIAFYRRAGFAVLGTSTFAMAGHTDQDFIMGLPLPRERPQAADAP